LLRAPADTADTYGGGRSEEIIGRWLASRPARVTEPVVLATKGRFPLDDSPNGAGLSARYLTRALDASLRRLGVQAVDLYQVHAFDPWTPLEETVRTLDGFARAGKIRYWGLSNFTGWQLTKAVHLARALNAAGPVTLQPQYSLLVRQIECEIVPAAMDAGLWAAAWSPLGGGWLSASTSAASGRPAPPPGRGPEPRHGGLRPAGHGARNWVPRNSGVGCGLRLPRTGLIEVLPHTGGQELLRGRRIVMRFAGVVVVAVARTSDEVVPARAQMATTLGFHIILACIGIALPTIVLLAEFIGLRRSNHVALVLARRWSQAMGVLIAVGAITGTVLSFELGLLWPGLMRRYGAVLGLPFGIEGLFFFLEAIFTAIYLYGWRRLGGWAHWWTGVPIAVSGILGAMSVIAVNSWMNQPGGFTARGGRIVSVNPWQVFFNHAAIYEMPHMILAAYMVTGFTVAGVYAAGILRGRRDRYHDTGFAIAFIPAAVLTPFQIFVGDTAARAIAHDQPVKFASMEYVARTSRDVPEWLGGVYANGHIYAGLRIPGMDSLLVGFSTGTKVTGWDSVPPPGRPPVVWLIHLCFDVMVGLGFLLLLAGLWALYGWWRRRRLPRQRLFWLLGAVSGVAAIVAMECGWVVTEVGRQPWVVYRLQTTTAAATTNGGVIASLSIVIALYAVLGAATILILRLLARRWRRTGAPEAAVPYGPPPGPQDRALGRAGS
jgi:cytochrome d ubiquinol oxidase subunit I